MKKVQEGFKGIECVSGPDGYKDVIFARDQRDLERMMTIAARIGGFMAAPIHNRDEAITARGVNAREMAEWEVQTADIYDNPPPDAQQRAQREEAARQEATKRLDAGEVAVRIAGWRIGSEHPNTGDFYSQLFQMRDAEGVNYALPGEYASGPLSPESDAH